MFLCFLFFCFQFQCGAFTVNSYLHNYAFYLFFFFSFYSRYFFRLIEIQKSQKFKAWGIKSLICLLLFPFCFSAFVSLESALATGFNRKKSEMKCNKTKDKTDTFDWTKQSRILKRMYNSRTAWNFLIQNITFHGKRSWNTTNCFRILNALIDEGASNFGSVFRWNAE